MSHHQPQLKKAMSENEINCDDLETSIIRKTQSDLIGYKDVYASYDCLGEKDNEFCTKEEIELIKKMIFMDQG